jgi:hypothetical protein
VSDGEISGLRPRAVPSTTAPEIDSSDRNIVDVSKGSAPPEASSSQPARKPSSIRRLSKFNLFRRNSSSKTSMNPPMSSSNSETVLAKSNPHNPPTTKPPDTIDQHNLSPQLRPQSRTPTASPYASPRTSVYGALSSPGSSTSPAEIFERSIESVPSISTQSPSVKGVPTYQVLEDIIPPALEATATTFTDHVNPDNVEIVMLCEVQSSESRSNAGSPVPSSPVLSAEAAQNAWEHDRLTSGSPDLDGKMRTLNLMSAADHLADEIIHPALPAPVDKRHSASPVSLSPAMKPADTPSMRPVAPDLSMERSLSQSSIGEAVVVKQNMGEALRHQRHHAASGHNEDVSPSSSATATATARSSLDAGHLVKKSM